MKRNPEGNNPAWGDRMLQIPDPEWAELLVAGSQSFWSGVVFFPTSEETQYQFEEIIFAEASRKGH